MASPIRKRTIRSPIPLARPTVCSPAARARELAAVTRACATVLINIRTAVWSRGRALLARTWQDSGAAATAGAVRVADGLAEGVTAGVVEDATAVLLVLLRDGLVTEPTTPRMTTKTATPVDQMGCRRGQALNLIVAPPNISTRQFSNRFTWGANLGAALGQELVRWLHVPADRPPMTATSTSTS